MDEKIKIEDDTVTISAGDHGQIAMHVADLLEFQQAISAIASLYVVGEFQTLEFTLKQKPDI